MLCVVSLVRKLINTTTTAAIARVHVAWLTVHEGSDFAELRALLSSSKVVVHDVLCVGHLPSDSSHIVGDKDVAAALVALTPHPVRLLSMRVENAAGFQVQLLRSTRATHVRLIALGRQSLNGAVGLALAQNEAVRRVDVFFSVLVQGSSSFLRALCTGHAFPDGLLIGNSLAHARTQAQARERQPRRGASGRAGRHEPGHPPRHHVDASGVRGAADAAEQQSRHRIIGAHDPTHRVRRAVRRQRGHV